MTKTCLTIDEILQTLPAIIGDCLGVDEAEVQPTANFYHDLGGDSIDELDLSFRCERAFGVKRGPFRALGELASGQPWTDGDGFIRQSLIECFCEHYPFLQSLLDGTGKSRWTYSDLKDLFTVDLIARLVQAEAQRTS